jgi:hypothetical protein
LLYDQIQADRGDHSLQPVLKAPVNQMPSQ